MRSISNFKELKLYHQIHPIKLGTDIASAIAFLFLLWRHKIAPALLIWPPNVENVKNSPLGKYVSKYMTPTIEVVRLLTLVPMAWGAWIHHIWLIVLGFVVLLFAWCNGLFWPHRTVRGGGHGQL
jgi:hypothetical protein